MPALARAGPFLRAVVMLLTLGILTTAAVTAALGAWLPHRELKASMGFVDPPDKEIYSVSLWRFVRPGMERRSWYANIPGANHLPSGLTWYSAWGRVAGKTRSDGFLRPRREWGTFGAMLRGERSARDEATEDARGWPWLVAWCEIKEPSPGAACTISGGIALPPEASHVAAIRCIPLRPIWTGFWLNTVTYALAWSMPLLAWPRVRSFARRRRGHCPRCAYDLRHDLTGGCPECGWRRSPRTDTSS